MNTLKYLVEKYNLDLNQKSPIEIPNVGRIDLVRWFRELGFKRGAEIGVENGEFSKLICDNNHQLSMMYGVDPYLSYPEYREYYDQENLNRILEAAKWKMRNYTAHKTYTFIRKKSMDALAYIADESLDFVYIDANHEAPFVLQDIEGWAKKVRKGGIVSGHDFVRVRPLNYAIKDALEEYSKKNDIQYFVLGSFMVRPREIRDSSRSWCFIKE